MSVGMEQDHHDRRGSNNHGISEGYRLCETFTSVIPVFHDIHVSHFNHPCMPQKYWSTMQIKRWMNTVLEVHSLSPCINLYLYLFIYLA